MNGKIRVSASNLRRRMGMCVGNWSTLNKKEKEEISMTGMIRLM
jgi:hypothetical protein